MNPLFLTLALLGCGNNGGPPSDAVRLEWSQAEEFHMGVRYRTDAPAGAADAWSDEVVWTYQVVEEGFTPAPDEVLYGFAEGVDGAPLPVDVVRAWVDASLNDDPELLETDPVVYFVFHADRDQLAGAVSFQQIGSERQRRSWKASELDGSTSTLGQSALLPAPSYLAPTAARFRDQSWTLEDGSQLETITDGSAVDVVFEDAFDGSFVRTRYEPGMPWPTYTESASRTARLLDEAEVEGRRRPWLPDAPEVYDYQGALAQAIDLDSSEQVDVAALAEGQVWGAVPAAFLPWGANYIDRSDSWNFAAELCSLPIRDSEGDDAWYLAQEAAQDLAAAITSGDAEALATAEAEWQTRADALDVLLDDRFDTLLQRFNGGFVEASDPDWTGEPTWLITALPDDHPHFEMLSSDVPLFWADLTTLERWTLYAWANEFEDPFQACRQELGSWGIRRVYVDGRHELDRGLSNASVLTFAPGEASTSVIGQDATLSAEDGAELLAMTHEKTDHHSFRGDDGPLEADHFHRLIDHYVRRSRVPVVIEEYAGSSATIVQAVEYIDYQVLRGPEGRLNINVAEANELAELPGIGEAKAWRIVFHRTDNGPFQSIDDLVDVKSVGKATVEGLRDLVTVDAANGRQILVTARLTALTPSGGDATTGYDLTYILDLDEDDRIVSGAWGDSDYEGPNEIRVPYNNPLGRARGGPTENPGVTYGDVVDLFGDLRKLQFTVDNPDNLGNPVVDGDLATYGPIPFTSDYDGFTRVPIEVFPGNSSVLLSARGGAPYLHLHELHDPDGNLVFDSISWAEATEALTYATWPNDNETVFNWPPREADEPLRPGKWTATLFSQDADGKAISGDTVDVTVQAKSDSDLSQGTVRATVFIAEGIDSDELRTGLGTAFDVWRGLYGEAGLELELDLKTAELPLDLASPGNGNQPLYERMSVQGGRDDLTILVTDTIDGGTDLLGVAGGIPGTLVHAGRSVMLVSWLTSRGTDAVLQDDEANQLGRVIAHEVGHYMGLFHVMESSWDFGDALEDTPWCTDQFDCEDEAGSNLMFPYPICEGADCDALSVITPDQQGVLHRYTGSL